MNQNEALSEFDNPEIFFGVLFQEKKQDIMLLQEDYMNCKSIISKALIKKAIEKERMRYAKLIKDDLELTYLFKDDNKEESQSEAPDEFIPFE